MQNGPREKSCDIQSGGQEMAVMEVVYDKKFMATIQVNLCTKFT